ncbi:unnamed protein product [Trifolium pratense]|uniref:Uncharacterized protein n=1 Tax=Trifolium pratense TaxID=57577 RepID=A0ACB0JLW8_TRIPR|nr:unnamed protein product [Trifolium pratense]
MIQSESDAKKRDEYIQHLMQLPNQKWMEIIGQIHQNVEFLKDQDVIRTVHNILQRAIPFFHGQRFTGIGILQFMLTCFELRYYTMYGHVDKLAEEIKKGAASVEGVDPLRPIYGREVSVTHFPFPSAVRGVTS